MPNGQLPQTHSFSFPARSYDPATGVATFDYALEGADGELRFTEVITFPLPGSLPGPAATRAAGT